MLSVHQGQSQAVPGSVHQGVKRQHMTKSRIGFFMATGLLQYIAQVKSGWRILRADAGQALQACDGGPKVTLCDLQVGQAGKRAAVRWFQPQYALE